MKKTVFKNLGFTLLMVIFIVGCAPDKKVNGKITINNNRKRGDASSLVGIRIIPNKVFVDLVSNFQKSNQIGLADESVLADLEAEITEIGIGVTNVSDISTSLFEIHQRRLNIAKQTALSIGQWVRSLPPINTQVRLDEDFHISSSSDNWLFVSVFNNSSAGNGKAGDGFQLWIKRVADCGESIVFSDDTMVESNMQFWQVLSGISSLQSDLGADKSLIEWATVVRSKAVKSKQIFDEKMRGANWKTAIELLKAKKLVSGDRFVVPGGKPEFVVRSINNGSFIMGSPVTEGMRNLDEVEHKVVISDGFFISETECSQGQWQFVMTNNPSYFKGVDRPVEQVSWDEANRYCIRLTDIHRKTGLIGEDMEWRLPTESQWEYASSAGGLGDGGLNLDLVAVYSKNSGSSTHKVKSKFPNAWGLYEMKGNVWEWCFDWYGEYDPRESVDPVRISISSGRVFRGGGWLLGSEYCRSASRRWSAPSLRYSYVGFRPVLVLVRR